MADMNGPEALEGIRVDLVPWQSHQTTLMALRTQVFIYEQGVSAADEWDDRDADALHFLVSDEHGAALATARLLPEGKLTRMAVAKPHRNRGIGTVLLKHIMQFADAQGLLRLSLDAQLPARAFYQRQGFEAAGEVFLDAGIRHVHMSRSLATDPAEMLSGKVIRFEYRSKALAAMRLYAAEARRTVDIFSGSLPPAVYADAELLTCLSALARGNARSKIRILVRDTWGLRGVEHALVTLAKRLPSRFAIRRLADDIAAAESGYFCVDRAHLLYFANEAKLTGFARFGARAEARPRLAEFDTWWHYASEEDVNLRNLFI